MYLITIKNKLQTILGYVLMFVIYEHIEFGNREKQKSLLILKINLLRAILHIISNSPSLRVVCSLARKSFAQKSVSDI